MKEVWTKFYYNSCKTHYSVSSTGRVRNDTTGYILNLSTDVNGYKRVSLSIEGKSVPFILSRLVATVYLPNPNNFPEVDHLNADKNNNSVSNLEWVSSEENKRRARENNLYISRPGELSPVTSYSNKMIENVCKLMSTTKIPLDDISKESGVSVNVLNKIRLGYRWKEVSDGYDFSEYNRYIQSQNTIKHLGLNNPNGKYSDEEITHVCKLLEENEMCLNEISKITGIPKNTVIDIKSGKAHVNISKLFNVRNHDMLQSGYHKKDLDKASELLLQGISIPDIISTLNFPNTKRTVSMLYGRQRRL